jgi:hypothetical protein
MWLRSSLHTPAYGCSRCTLVTGGVDEQRVPPAADVEGRGEVEQLAANAFGASAANAAINRDTVGSDATRPNTPGSHRSTATSARQSPPTASAIARSTRTLPGSCWASGLRHGASAADYPLVRPVLSAVRASTTAPACDTTPEPPASTENLGYHDSGFFNLRQVELSLLRAPFFVYDINRKPQLP